MRECTPSQKKLVQIYHSMKKPNKREAYEKVYKARGETARVEAERTLRLPHAKAYLRRLQKKSEARALKTADDIIRELEKVAFSSIENYIQVKKGKIILNNLAQLTDDQLGAIAEISAGPGGALKFRLYDKLKALKDLGLRYGIFPTHIEHKGELTLAQAVHEALKDEHPSNK